MPVAPGRSQVDVAQHLEARRAEIEQAILARVYGVADPTEVGDHAYVEGLRAAASAALDFAVETLESPEDPRPLVPAVLLAQARLAARSGVGLDTVLRRYTAGHALLVDFLVKELEREETLPPAELRRLLAVSSSAFDRLLAAVSEEHARELESRVDFSQERRRALLVKCALAGEPIDASRLNYDLDLFHVGVIACGSGAVDGIRKLASRFDKRLLLVRCEEETVWAWLGSHRRIEAADLVRIADFVPTAVGSFDPVLAFGEPSEGLHGWRQTHRQAAAALFIARTSNRHLVRYADVCLLASIARDDLLVESLEQLYLMPLSDGRDGGAALRKTLHTYLSVRNISSAAAALDLNRQTVRNRLRDVEEKIGRSIDDCAAELAIALELHRLMREPSRPLP